MKKINYIIAIIDLIIVAGAIGATVYYKDTNWLWLLIFLIFTNSHYYENGRG